MCENNKSCITINMNCCDTKNTDNETTESRNNNDTPVGTIIAYMGVNAPHHYLFCDGSILKITEYPYLADQIKTEFGVINYFGGDGKVTFAIPNLQGEFLRGYGKQYGTSSEIGIHQDGSINDQIINAYNVDGVDAITIASKDSESKAGVYNPVVRKVDYIVPTTEPRKMLRLNVDHRWTDSVSTYGEVQRPTNVAVLYCIKYE